MNRTLIYPGTFDPITYGHLDVIERAAHLFDHIHIAVAIHTPKSTLFSAEERAALISASLYEITTSTPITVAAFEGLLIDYVRKQNAVAILRGLRAVSDFEYEFQLALMNRELDPSIETLFLMPRATNSFLSSSLVKEIASLGGQVESFVPPPVAQALKQKFALTPLH
jgi:pantetheine-phosphate adenylyltransferase